MEFDGNHENCWICTSVLFANHAHIPLFCPMAQAPFINIPNAEWSTRCSRSRSLALIELQSFKFENVQLVDDDFSPVFCNFRRVVADVFESQNKVDIYLIWCSNLNSKSFKIRFSFGVPKEKCSKIDDNAGLHTFVLLFWFAHRTDVQIGHDKNDGNHRKQQTTFNLSSKRTKRFRL